MEFLFYFGVLFRTQKDFNTHILFIQNVSRENGQLFIKHFLELERVYIHRK